MQCFEFNPNPPVPPSPPSLNRIYVFSNTNPGELALDFLNFYHRSNFNYQMEVQPDGKIRMVRRPKSSAEDSVILNEEQISQIRGDAEVNYFERRIRQRMVLRSRDFINQINCDEEKCFTDSGVEITSTTPFTDESYALGHFSLYWFAECKVGPRRCELDLPNCEPGKGSVAEYELKISWRLYDIYDFTGLQQIVPFSWGGTDFQVFGEWETTKTGTVATCESPQDNFGSISCQDSLQLITTYNIMYTIVEMDDECPSPNLERVIDSAMGRLLADGKVWCNTGHCRETNINCEPIFSNVLVETGGLSVVRINDTKKKCLMLIGITTDIRCRCLPTIEVPFPSPDRIEPMGN